MRCGTGDVVVTSGPKTEPSRRVWRKVKYQNWLCYRSKLSKTELMRWETQYLCQNRTLDKCCPNNLLLDWVNDSSSLNLSSSKTEN